MWVVEIPYLKGIVGTIGGLKHPKIKNLSPASLLSPFVADMAP